MKSLEALEKELSFKMSRSAGKGGQHVNKVSTRVTVFFDIPNSACFDPEEKALLLLRLAPRLSKEGVLQISCQKTRSQLKNKQTVVRQLEQLLNEALQVDKPRKKVSLPSSIKTKRRKAKALQAEKKQGRKKVSLDDLNSYKDFS